jgi:ectoine hydroxylase-related dioxygenase (phytanoyl-CoA dioxygenase family)
LLGPKAVLFNDQYIVKPSQGGNAASFSWHRDSDWCREGSFPHPYISIWIALDDCEVENGCLFVRPGSHADASSDYVHVPGLEPEIEASQDFSSSLTMTGILDDSGRAGNSSNTESPPLENCITISKNKINGAAAVPLLLSAGSAVIMTDVVEHASGANTTQYARRGWMPQFSYQPVLWKESKTPVSLAIPLNEEI